MQIGKLMIDLQETNRFREDAKPIESELVEGRGCGGAG